MSFQITMQQCNSDPRKVGGKVITTIGTVQGVLKDESSIQNPIVKITANLEGIRHCNYAYIPIFERKYYVTDIKAITANIVEVYMHVDVLETYATAIKSCEGLVCKQENQGDLMLNDTDYFQVKADRIYQTKAFSGSAMSSGGFILVTSG